MFILELLIRQNIGNAQDVNHKRLEIHLNFSTVTINPMRCESLFPEMEC